MKVGYAVLYEDGKLVISKEHTILPKPIYKDFAEFEDTYIPWRCESYYEKIKSVQILNKIKPFTVYGWFYHCKNLTALLDFQNLDVSDCEDFSCLFQDCKSLTDISSLSTWNLSNGKDFSSMFDHCESLMNISALANWNVFNGKDFCRMFAYCQSLKDISSLQNWDISNGINFSRIFFGCKGLIVSTALENWNMEHAKNINGMFFSCFNLKEIHLSDTLQFLNRKMFINCNANLRIHWKGKIYIYSDLMEYQEF